MRRRMIVDYPGAVTPVVATRAWRLSQSASGRWPGHFRPCVITSRIGAKRTASSKEVAMTGYCVKCRSSREIKNAQSITMKNGRPATQGVCPTCGTKMFRIGKG